MPTSSTSSPAVIIDWLPQTSVVGAERHMSPFGVICFILIILVLIGSIMASKDSDQGISGKIKTVAASVVGTTLTLWAISSIFEAKAWYFTSSSSPVI